jgi:transcriptional regulator with XRE-family HTH domain
MARKRPRREGGPPGYLRAAIAYADLTQPEIRDALHVHESTINRWLKSPAAKDYKAPSPEQLGQIATLTGVPLWFLQSGFAEPAPQTGDERLAELEARVAAIERDRPDVKREIHEAFEDYASRLGERIGKRPPRSRRSQDRPAAAAPAAA